MISFPWSLILTATFAFTGIICVIHLVTHRRGSDTCSVASAARMDMVVHGNHLVMSIGMILMVWIDMSTVATWVEVGFFTILALIILIGTVRAPGPASTISLSSHLGLNAAMVWMLLAMPLLMDHHMSGGHGGGSEMAHSEMAHSMTMAPTPDWVIAVNWLAITLSVLAAAWWIVLLMRSRRVGLHTFCHAVMGLGMALMLGLM